MKPCLRPLLLSLLLACTFGTTACVAQSSSEATIEPLSQFPQGALTISTEQRELPFKIWLADTAAHREQGLMFINELALQTGMLFVFDRPQPIAMWMKNTLIPLDMLFINVDGRVDSIIANATPLSLKILRSEHLVLGVLEIAGGSAAKLGIKQGAIVKHPAFASVGGSR